MMRNDKDKTGRAATRAVAAPPVYTAEQRETVRRGLRILAKISARAHLRRQAACTRADAPGPPTVTKRGEQAIPKNGGPD